MKKALIVGLILSITTMNLLGCGGGKKDKPVQTIKWQPDGNGYTQFYTNDEACKYWNYWYYGFNKANPMSTVTIEAKKVSGKSTLPFGMVFCMDDHGENGYGFVIATNQTYCIFKFIDEEITLISNWTGTPYIYSDSGAINVLSVTRNKTTGTVYFDINNNVVGSLSDLEYSGGSSGFFVSVQENEDFPNKPVDVRFKDVTQSMASLRQSNSGLHKTESNRPPQIPQFNTVTEKFEKIEPKI